MSQVRHTKIKKRKILFYEVNINTGAALIGSQEVPEEDDGRIIAGTKAKVGEFPYVVSLQYTDKTDGKFQTLKVAQNNSNIFQMD